MSQRWLLGAWAALLILIIYMANTNSLPGFFDAMRKLPGGDKAGHFFLLGVASLLANLSLRTRVWEFGKLRLLQGSVIVGTMITLEECTQAFSPNRSFSLSDMCFNFAGIIVFGRVARWHLSRLDSVAEPLPEQDVHEKAASQVDAGVDE